MGSSKADVEVSYDISNEFFRLWLDERMNYTSAVYETPDQSLEALLERHAATRTLLEVHAEADAARTLYHPFMDDLDALDWLRMAAYQTRHHRLSIQAGLDRLNAGQK